MEHSRRLNSHIILLSLCFSFLSVSSCKEQKVTIVIPKTEEGFGLLRLDYFSGQLDDTVHVDEDYIGILNCYKDMKLNGSMFEFIYFNENGKKIKIPEFDFEKNKSDTSNIYFKHGMFIGRNNSNYILYFIGNPKYLMQVSNDFNIESPELENKLDLGENKISN